MESDGVGLTFHEELRSVKKKRRRKNECFQVIMRVIDASFDYLVLRKETPHNFLWEGNITKIITGTNPSKWARSVPQV